MCNNTLVTLSPLNPYDNTYNHENPDDPYGVGELRTYGGHTNYFSPYTLSDQATADNIILGYNPVPLANQSINNIVSDVYRHSAVRCVFRGRNISMDNQYLVIYSLNSYAGSPTAQFFVGTDLVRTEEIIGQHQVALLMDVPGDGVYVTLYLRLASDNYYSMLAFQSVSVHLL